MSDQSLHCSLFLLHLLESLAFGETTLFQFYNNYIDTLMSQFLGFSKYTMSGQLTSKIPRSSLDLAQVQDCLEIPLLGHLQYWLPNHRHV